MHAHEIDLGCRAWESDTIRTETMIDVLVVNLNCLWHTKNLVVDLYRQTGAEFRLTIVDQGSKEQGTKEYLDLLEASDITVVRNGKNIPLNWIWNQFVRQSDCKTICLLNNDIRIPSNFLSDINKILARDPKIGAVMHATNHPKYARTLPQPEYVTFDHGFRQGWDICVRKECWKEIPKELKLYCGDDFLFENIYRMGYKVALATSSPIVHHLNQTRKNNRNISNRRPLHDDKRYVALGYELRLVFPEDYTCVRPQIEWISEHGNPVCEVSDD